MLFDALIEKTESAYCYSHINVHLYIHLGFQSLVKALFNVSSEIIGL